jgi:hypothetical protein
MTNLDERQTVAGVLSEPPEQRIRRQAQALVFQHAFVAIAGGLCALVGIRLFYWTAELGSYQTLWFLALLGCLLLRTGAAVYYRAVSVDATDESLPWAYNFYFLASVAEALVWGASMFLMFPPEPTGQTFLLVVLIALAVGAMASFAGSFPLYAIYATILHLSVVVRLLMIQDPVYFGLAALTPALLIVLLVIARQMDQQMFHIMKLSIKNEQLAMIEAASKASMMQYSERLSVQSVEVEKVSAENRALRKLISQDLRTHLIALHQASRYLKEQGGSPYDQQTLIDDINLAAEEGLHLLEESFPEAD